MRGWGDSGLVREASGGSGGADWPSGAEGCRGPTSCGGWNGAGPCRRPGITEFTGFLGEKGLRVSRCPRPAFPGSRVHRKGRGAAEGQLPHAAGPRAARSPKEPGFPWPRAGAVVVAPEQQACPTEGSCLAPTYCCEKWVVLPSGCTRLRSRTLRFYLC